jgi:SNF2 family DNA or RNA helicase
MGELLLADDHLVAKFDYNPELVAEIKQITGSKFDRYSKTWRIPVTATDAAVKFALNHNWWVDPELVTIDLPEAPPDAKLEFDGDRVFLHFSYDPVKVRAVKRIPGVTWDKTSKGWVAPAASLAEAVDWAETFGVAVDETTKQWILDITEKRDELIRQSRETDADLDVAGLPLLPYQRAGVKYAAAARRTFIADDMGLGKTIQAIATVELTQAYPCVVVCPPTLVLNWAKEYEKWLPYRKVATVKNRKDFPDPGYEVLIVGYSNIKAWEQQLKNHAGYVFDESHYCKSLDAQRTKAAIKAAKTAPQEGVVLCLTGTPVTNKPAEYAAQLEILGKIGDFGGRWGFYRRYCNAFRDRFGQWNIEGHSNLDELNERLRGNCYIRRTKEQVLDELPPVRHHRMVVDGTAGGMKEYRKAEADIVNYLMERAREIAEELGLPAGSAAVRARMRAEGNEHLVRIGVLRKLAARAKMPAVTELVESYLNEGKKVVLAAHHREIVDELASKYGNLKIQGQMKVEEVERHKAAFQELPASEAPSIVLSIQAAKTGHTLTAAQDVVFVELPWTWADIEQTYSRCHRLGQKGSVTATFVLCADTIDEQMFDLVEQKRDVVGTAVDGLTVASSSQGVLDNFLKLLTHP